MLGEWFIPKNWIEDDYLLPNLEACIPKRYFILIGAIDLDLLIAGICSKIRENRFYRRYDNVLEDMVGEAVRARFAKIALSAAEARGLAKSVSDALVTLTVRQLAQKNLNK